MKILFPLCLAAGVLAAGATASSATAASDAGFIRVSGGCGHYWHRGPSGGCIHDFPNPEWSGGWHDGDGWHGHNGWHGDWNGGWHRGWREGWHRHWQNDGGCGWSCRHGW